MAKKQKVYNHLDKNEVDKLELLIRTTTPERVINVVDNWIGRHIDKATVKVIKDPLTCNFQTASGKGGGHCSRVPEGATKRGNCTTCRVAAEWEEAYG